MGAFGDVAFPLTIVTNSSSDFLLELVLEPYPY